MSAMNWLGHAKETLCQLMRELYDQKILTDIGGNLSVHELDSSSFWITPSGKQKNTVSAVDLVEVDLTTGSVLSSSSGLKPSVEWLMHRTIYQTFPEVTGVLHAHPPLATAYSLLKNPPIIPHLTLETKILVPELKVLPYAASGSEELALLLADGLKTRDIVILKNHGSVVVTRSSLTEAAIKTRALEELLNLYLLSNQFGGDVTPFPD